MIHSRMSDSSSADTVRPSSTAVQPDASGAGAGCMIHGTSRAADGLPCCCHSAVRDCCAVAGPSKPPKHGERARKSNATWTISHTRSPCPQMPTDAHSAHSAHRCPQCPRRPAVLAVLVNGQQAGRRMCRQTSSPLCGPAIPQTPCPALPHHRWTVNPNCTRPCIEIAVTPPASACLLAHAPVLSTARVSCSPNTASRECGLSWTGRGWRRLSPNLSRAATQLLRST
jgi:hypothetical protein